MENGSMTALVSAFSRWVHAMYEGIKVFDDTVAGRLLSDAEKQGIAENMGKGIAFFNPGFTGTQAEAVRWIVDNQLSPTPLGRAAFCEGHLQGAARRGAAQYLVMAAGYDTFAYRQPDWAGLRILEVDHPITGQDKQRRLAEAGIASPPNVAFLAADFSQEGWGACLRESGAFDATKVSFCSLLGISYYLTKNRFASLLRTLSEAMPAGSSLAFDYPDQDSHTDRAGPRAKKQAQLAGAAREAMRAAYAFAEMEALLADHGFAIREHLIPAEITPAYFAAYNQANPSHEITAFDNVNYCLAVKR